MNKHPPMTATNIMSVAISPLESTYLISRQRPYIMAAVINEQMILPVVLIGSARRKDRRS